VPETLLQVRSDRQVHRPYGLAGGQEGAASANLITRADGQVEGMNPMFGAVLGEGDVFLHRTAGGGGWGDPLDRDPVSVATDVKEEKVSRRAARQSYGVILDERGEVDMPATVAHREGLRAQSTRLELVSEA
jgi:N-methylhydantoinase B